MGILDKLKPQPRWKHADPAVRLEAIREMDDPVELAALAETDPDVKVRRAAVAVVEDPDCLGRIAGSDADADARDRASERLVTLACRPLGSDSLDADATLALWAVNAIADPRRLSTVAKSDAVDAVRNKALSRIERRARARQHRPACEARVDGGRSAGPGDGRRRAARHRAQLRITATSRWRRSTASPSGARSRAARVPSNCARTRSWSAGGHGPSSRNSRPPKRPARRPRTNASGARAR